MCVACVAVVTAISLVSPNQNSINDFVKNEYTITKKSCPKSKVNKTENNKICVKSGKVYRWAVKNTLDKPSTVEPTPTPTPIPTVEPTPTPTPIPTVEPTPTPTAEPIQETKKPSRLQSLWKKINNQLNSRKLQNNIKINAIYSPNVNKDYVKEFVSKYEVAINLYSGIIKENPTFVFFNENEKDWWKNKSIELEGHKSHTDWWDSGHCPISSKVICGYGSNNVPYALFYQMIGSNSAWGEISQMSADHESVHVMQRSLLKDGSPYPGCWAIEGQANSLGIARLSHSYSELFAEQFYIQQVNGLNRLISAGSWKNTSKQEWINILSNFDKDPQCFSKGTGYSLGMIIFDYFYKNWTIDEVNSFMIEYSRSLNFDSSLQNVFKISRIKLSEDISELILGL